MRKTYFKPDYNLSYLREMVTEAIDLHLKKDPESRWTENIIKNYFLWLTLQAMIDKSYARSFVFKIASLQEELEKSIKIGRKMKSYRSSHAYYEGFLHGIERTISFSHKENILFNEKIDWNRIILDWKKVEVKMGLHLQLE